MNAISFYIAMIGIVIFSASDRSPLDVFMLGLGVCFYSGVLFIIFGLINGSFQK